MNQDLTPQIVYDDDEIRVIWQQGSSQLLLITYGDLINPADGHRYFADAPLRKAGITALGIMAKRGNWYPQQNLQEAYQKIQPLIEDYHIRIAYGGSMGGYAAIKYSRLFGATHVIALCPQWSIDMAECDSFDPTWQKYFHEGMRGMGIRAADVQGHVFLFLDNLDPLEMFHCRKIIEAYPTAHFINVPMVSHHVTSVFAGTANLVALINACLTVNLDALMRFSRETRRNSRIWRSLVIGAALKRLPKLGYRALVKYSRQDITYLKLHQSYILQVLTDIGQQDGIEAAVKLFQQCRIFLDPVEQVKTCAQLTRLGGASLQIETFHKTALIYDLKENKCINGVLTDNAFESCIEMEILGHSAALYTVIGELKFYLAVGPQRNITIPDIKFADTSPFSFEIDQVPNGKFAVKCAGQYLSAERNGTVSCNRKAADGWEHFMIGAYLTPKHAPDQQVKIDFAQPSAAGA
jgi:hypothetical protein